ncbi:sulfurtransferase [Sphingomonas donggukensis]|uniref:Sulfurtransferase n=1 Tax=Sphingomonas donggukensis TaxID=2949093 RepID=A0ABY4TX24_9SPHN|nr:sulfurtransferase [Sphingomonas donggukensis]URW75709.1 sulfurtransferase [Sphingomonas donggukensis]
MGPLVTPDQLAAAQNVRILDATWFLPEHGRDARAEHAAAHIPGTLFLDLPSLNGADGNLADPAAFAARMGALGVRESDAIVLYDNSPLHTSARAWWALRTMGARNIAILDGGLTAWTAAGHPTETGVSTPTPTVFTAKRDTAASRNLAQMRRATEQVVDARGPGRFTGTEPEPRAGVASGHIPGAINLPYARMFAADGTWKSPSDLAAAFADAGVDIDRPIVTTCGSGVTAANLVFALDLLDRDAPLYDGSWTEWGSDPTTPKELGA